MKKPLLFGSLLTMALLTGCGGESKSLDEYRTAAQQQYQAKQYDAAVTELKNLLKVEPKDANARFLLASSYINMGIGEAAEKEFKLALAAGYSAEKIKPLLAKALLLQYQFEAILNEVTTDQSYNPESNAAILVYRGIAEQKLSNTPAALALYDQAINTAPNASFSQLAKVFLAIQERHIDDAKSTLSTLLEQDPEISEAWLVQGQLFQREGNYELALSSFKQYQKLLPDDKMIRLLMADSYISSEQYDKAETLVDSILENFENHGLTNYFKGLIRYYRKDLDGAKLHLEKAIQNGYATPNTKLMAGVVNFQLENYEQSYNHLYAIEKQLAPDHPARKILAITQLKLGYNLDANNILATTDSITEQDKSLLAAASFQLVKAGNVNAARALIDRADKISSNDPGINARQGLLKLSIDDTDGIKDLEQSLQLDDKNNTTRLALGMAYIQTQAFDKAEQLANDWLARSPDNIGALNLAAFAATKQNKLTDAVSFFNKALEVDPANPPSRIYFANQAKSAGDLNTAKEQLYITLSKYPYNVASWLQLYPLSKVSNAVEDYLQKLAATAKTANVNSDIAGLYVRILFNEQQYKDIFDFYKNYTFDVNSAELNWQAYGQTLIQDKQNALALAHYKKWYETQSNSKEATSTYIQLLEKQGEKSQALKVATEASVKFPDDSSFVLMQAHYLIENDNALQAQRVLESLSKQEQLQPATRGLLGRALLSQGKTKDALPLLKSFYRTSPNPLVTSMIYAATQKSVGSNEAIDFLRTHVQQHPNDLASRITLAEQLIQRAPKESQSHYLAVIEQQPNNLLALNNLAYVESQLKDYPNAELHALAAKQLQPENPQVLDTLGTIYLKQHKSNQALELLTKANRLMPNNPNVTLNLAESLIQTGNKTKAATILDELATRYPTMVSKVAALKANYKFDVL